jgi:hypothetical protein
VYVVSKVMTSNCSVYVVSKVMTSNKRISGGNIIPQKHVF